MADTLYGMAGTWKLTKSENFEDFLRELGVNLIARKMAGRSNPLQEISLNSDEITLKTITGFWDTETKFKIGEEFQQKSNGVQQKCLAIWEGETMVLTLTPIDGSVKSQKTTRTLINGELHVVMTVGDVICTRIYQKQ
ncbi:unnamed protein product [Owenia fusiformis]|uniref:Cytosolic fatty-acid binding proteins domain-containing protein n=1 Tax=Owenia fusiformis TaxID=6347 RepID=A0A8S4QCC0_OWEFU|nr:unnamed protein product [Owenia fusiformis]